MASYTVYSAIFVEAQEIAAAQGLPLVHDEALDDALTEQGQAFACLVDAETVDQLSSIGSPAENWYKENGELEINIYVPARDGFGPARAHAQAFAEGLRHKILANNVKTEAPQPPAPGVIASGQWSHMVVGIPFTRQRAAATA